MCSYTSSTKNILEKRNFQEYMKTIKKDKYFIEQLTP